MFQKLVGEKGFPGHGTVSVEPLVPVPPAVPAVVEVDVVGAGMTADPSLETSTLLSESVGATAAPEAGDACGLAGAAAGALELTGADGVVDAPGVRLPICTVLCFEGCRAIVARLLWLT